MISSSFRSSPENKKQDREGIKWTRASVYPGKGRFLFIFLWTLSIGYNNFFIILFSHTKLSSLSRKKGLLDYLWASWSHKELITIKGWSERDSVKTGRKTQPFFEVLLRRGWICEVIGGMKLRKRVASDIDWFLTNFSQFRMFGWMFQVKFRRFQSSQNDNENIPFLKTSHSL